MTLDICEQPREIDLGVWKKPVYGHAPCLFQKARNACSCTEAVEKWRVCETIVPNSSKLSDNIFPKGIQQNVLVRESSIFRYLHISMLHTGIQIEWGMFGEGHY